MKLIPRIYLPTATANSNVELSDAQSRHLVRVLRLEDDAALKVFDGNGREFDAVLARANRTASARIGKCVREETDAALAITLVLSISRATRMEWALEKAVEFGVTDIRPALTERSKVKLDTPRAARRRAHWQGIIVSAAAQCGRARLPLLATATPLIDILKAIRIPNRIALIPEAARPLPSLPAPQGRVALLVGPESGFSPEETAAIADSGWQRARLGPRILRAETAAPAALAAIQTLWGDWRD